jgi:hypothetical protein
MMKKRISKRDIKRLTTFRIQPSHSSRLYLIVHVAKDVKEMRRTMRRVVGECHPRQVAGVMGLAPDRQSDVMFDDAVAIMFFGKDWIGAGLVAHEMAHAAFRVAERKHLKVDHWVDQGYTFRTQPAPSKASAEERYANIVEHLTRDFWTKAYAAGLVT